jgi:hypothetical protein
MSDAAAEVLSSHCMPVHPLLVASHACGAANCCLRPNQKMLLQSTLQPHLLRPQPHTADAQPLQLVRQGVAGSAACGVHLLTPPCHHQSGWGPCFLHPL